MVDLSRIGKQTMIKRVFEVRAEWGQLARALIATSADTLGLCCEAAEFEEPVATGLASFRNCLSPTPCSATAMPVRCEW